MRPPRLRDVAERAEVSIGLVSSYLNTPHLVGASSSQRIQQAIEELRFVPNDAARQLRRGVSRMIAFVAFDVGDPLFASVARGAQARAAEHGLRIVLADTNGDPQTERDYLALFEQQRVRGILLAPAGEPREYLDSLRTRGIPAVLIDQPAPDDGWSSVSVNDLLGGELAARHLLEQGRRRVAVVGGTDAIRQVRDRREGARAAAAAVPGATVTVVDTVERTVTAGRAAGAQVVAAGGADAVFCINDSMAIGVLQAFSEAGVRVPDDVAVIGYNDTATELSVTTGLSSVRQPHEGFGSVAVDLLMAELDETAAPSHRTIVLDPTVVVRQSTVGVG